MTKFSTVGSMTGGSGARPRSIRRSDVLARLAALKTMPTSELKHSGATSSTRAAALQSALPRKPAGLSHPGTGLRRAEAGDGRAAGGAWRAARWRQHRRPPHPRRRPADRRHPAASANGRASSTRVTVRARRLRISGPALQVALRRRPRHHRHPLERLGVLRPEEPAEHGDEPEERLRTQAGRPQAPLRGLHPQVDRGRARQEFNSLDAQREACEAYVASQKAEGWVLVPDRYDDGGFSGGTLERPALKRLLADIEAGQVDVVVVYKIDRLSRSLMDFAKLVEVFDRNDVTFVSVTQSFNTTTSMGRLTLNILLSFAQFEREVIGERIRDKFAASRKKGMWMGGWAPLGYDVKDRKLVINEAEAADRPDDLRALRPMRLGDHARPEAARPRASSTRTASRSTRASIYKLLNNRVYVGEAVHKGTAYPGEHEAIITAGLWDKVHAILQESPRKRAANTRAQTPALLKGLIFGPTGRAMSPTHTRQGRQALPLLRQPIAC